MNTLFTSSIPTVLAFIAVGIATISTQTESNETKLALIDLAGKALTVISTIVLSWLAWKQAVLISSVKGIKEELSSVKILVNGMSGNKLDTISTQADRLANLTKEQGDIDNAILAKKEVEEHKIAEKVVEGIKVVKANGETK